MAESADHKELFSQEESGDKVMMEGSGEQPESSEDASAGPGDDGDRGEEAAVGPGEEGGKGEEDAAGSGEGGEKGEETDEDSDPDHPKGLIGYLLDTDFVESLLVKVKYRVLALEKLQTRVANLESKFLREFHGIERKFAEMYQPLLEKRCQIINAIYEPTKEECEYKSDSEDCDDEMYDEEEMCGNEEGLLHDYMDEDDDYDDYAVEEEEEDGNDDDNDDNTKAAGDENKEEDPKGIPDFWLTVLKNQEGIVREVNDEIYDKIICDNRMVAIEEVKACCKNPEAIVENIDH
ncbi:hypothetical protein ABFV05_020369 [Capra hircus]